jgi:hypothetical protein
MKGFIEFLKEANPGRIKEDAVEPLLGEGGKGKAKFKLHFLHVKKKSLPVKAMTGKKGDRESGPDTPIQLNKGVPNRFQNIGQDVAMNI